jgi:cytochrome P450/flavodoxin
MTPSVSVIYGTESGNAEMVADDLVAALTERGADASAADMSDVDVTTLPDLGVLVVVCSTYEEGDLPATAQPFHAALLAKRPDLAGVTFAAFGLGDKSYDHFSNGIDTITAALIELGAKQIGDISKHDALGDEDASDQATAWLTGIADDLLQTPQPASSPTLAAAEPDDLFPWNDAEFQRDPYPHYARARAASPVHLAADGTYVVTRYDDVMKYFKLPIMSILEPNHEGQTYFGAAFNNTVLTLDPPDHAPARRLFSLWFTPKLIQRWVEYTREALAEILDDYVPGTRLDGHFALGVHPTHITMARVLDLPPGEAEPLFWALWDGMLIQATDPVPGTYEKAKAGVDYIFGRTEKLLLDKVDNPGTGLADEWIAKYKAGELTWQQVVANTSNFYMSGAPNPAYLIGSALEVFAKHPDVMRDYRNHPEIRAKIINEVARMNPVELLLTRFPTEDVEIRGVTIPAGSCIKFPIGAVNRDPEVFENPDDFDYTRSGEASRHLSFGLGTHACAGQAIARAEAEVILARVAEDYTQVEILEEPTRVITDRLVAYKSQPIALR